MTEQLINDMYILAVKSQLLRDAIPTEQKLALIFEELNASNIIVKAEQQIESIVPETELSIMTMSPNILGEKTDVKNHKYGQIPDEEGFNNMDLETSSDGQFYDLQLTENTQLAYFELITNNYVSQELRLSPEIAPDFAVIFENKLNSSSQVLSVIKKGTLKKIGRYWKIIEPCQVKWK